MSLRGQETLKNADLVLCEDTRQTAKLLGLLGLKAPLKRCDEHREAGMVRFGSLAPGPAFGAGFRCGHAADLRPWASAGAGRAGGRFPRYATPGPAAPILALILSGLPSDRFFFGGFLPTKASARLTSIQEIASLSATSLFFENPKRLPATLEMAQHVLGADRPAAIARELTKKFEEIRRAPSPACARA